jgi:hypothetical protein
VRVAVVLMIRKAKEFCWETDDQAMTLMAEEEVVREERT